MGVYIAGGKRKGDASVLARKKEGGEGTVRGITPMGEKERGRVSFRFVRQRVERGGRRGGKSASTLHARREGKRGPTNPRPEMEGRGGICRRFSRGGGIEEKEETCLLSGKRKTIFSLNTKGRGGETAALPHANKFNAARTREKKMPRNSSREPAARRRGGGGNSSGSSLECTCRGKTSAPITTKGGEKRVKTETEKGKRK